MTKLALSVQLVAKPGQEDEAAAFLASAQALVAAEAGTVAWFAVRFDARTFAIFDAFDDQAGREAHLTGRVAQALVARFETLFEGDLQIRQAEVLADKLPA